MKITNRIQTTVFASVVAACFVFTAPANAQVVEKTVPSIRKGPITLARGGGSNNGGSPRGSVNSDSTLMWCRGSQGVLNEFRTQASVAALDGDMAGAYALMLEGMTRALGSSTGQDSSSSLTYRALERGVDLASATSEVVGEDDASYEIRYLFLLRYYGFIDNTAVQLDIPFYIPAQDRHVGGAPSSDQFERRFVAYARDELSWLLEHFTIQTANYGIAPRGSVKGYLKTLEYQATYAADDLEDSLWAAKYSCAIQELRLMSAKLAAHNAGNLTYFRNDQRAVNSTYTQVKRIIGRLGEGC